VQVQGGTSGSVGVVAPRDLTATVPAGTAPEMQARIVYNGPVQAGFKAGDHIADLVVDSPGLPSQTVPLVAEKDVSEAGFFGRAWRGFWSLFGF
jgi:D-alanyl-D-alanine carboxypeptidase (penicillin-binding protein 5/6)